VASSLDRCWPRVIIHSSSRSGSAPFPSRSVVESVGRRGWLPWEMSRPEDVDDAQVLQFPDPAALHLAVWQVNSLSLGGGKRTMHFPDGSNRCGLMSQLPDPDLPRSGVAAKGAEQSRLCMRLSALPTCRRTSRTDMMHRPPLSKSVTEATVCLQSLLEKRL
jgi:hypothetical protein